jgi:hypothetical protein
MLAGKMLAGRPLRIDTDNPKTVPRARALGGSIREIETRNGRTVVVFDPTATQ